MAFIQLVTLPTLFSPWQVNLKFITIPAYAKRNRTSPEDDIRLLVSTNSVVSFSKLTCPRRQITIIHGKNLIPMKTDY